MSWNYYCIDILNILLLSEIPGPTKVTRTALICINCLLICAHIFKLSSVIIQFSAEPQNELLLVPNKTIALCLHCSSPGNVTEIFPVFF